MSEYRSGDLAEIFGVSRESVRRYTIEFQDFLSADATPTAEGKHRVYNDDDLRVFALVTRMKSLNQSDEDIKATLSAGERDDLPSLLTQGSTLNPSLQLTIARQEIDNLQSKLEFAVDEAQKWRDEANQLRGRIEQLQKQLDEQQSGQQTGQADVIELHKEIARLTVLLEMAKGQHNN